ncbi:MAG: rhomboid family intramembrane serine protease [Acidobacteriota bacterium]|nr:rhomboid family intramembrane serine protease [Acidobacteriota bacterium]
MFLPTGPENTSLRRRPVVTLGIIAVLLGLYMIRLPFSEPNLDAFRLALEYRAFRPYLKSDDAHFEHIYEQLSYWVAGELELMPDNADVRNREQQRLNSLVAEGMKSFNQRLVTRLGLVPYDPSPWGLVTYMFVQPGLIGLLINLFFLYITGPHLEDRWGRPFFAVFWVLGGVGAGVLFMITYPDSWQGVIGVSGAVSAVIGAYTVRYPTNRIRFKILIHLPGNPDLLISPGVLFPAWYLINFGIQYVRTVHFNEYPVSGYLPYVINLWGFAFGAVVAGVIRIFKLEPLLYQSPFEKLPEDQQLHIKIDDALAANKTEDAFNLLREAWTRFPKDRDFQLQFWDQSVRMQRESEAEAAGKDLIHHLVEQGNYENAVYHWTEYTRAFPGDNIVPARVADLTHGLLSIEFQDETREVLRYTFRHQGQTADIRVMINLVETASLTDPQAALEGIAVLRRRGDLADEEKARLDELEKDATLLAPAAKERSETIELSKPVRGQTMMEDPYSNTMIRTLRVTRAQMRALTDEGPRIKLADGREMVVGFAKIKAMTAAAVRPIDGKPYLVMDLMADDPNQDKPAHAVLRLDTRSFDPRRVVKEEKPAQAMRRIIEIILHKAAARPLPDRAQILGARFPSYPSIDELERQIYGVVSGR